MTSSNLSETKPAISPVTSHQYSLENRLYLEQLGDCTTAISAEGDAGQDVVTGLNQRPKSLPPKYFYDAQGSHLFELICELPEYYLTRTETAILQQYAKAIAVATGPSEIVELGSGSSTKTRILLDAYRDLKYPLQYLPIDISSTMLESSARQLLADYAALQIHALIGTYEVALAQLPPSRLPTRTICFLGSTLGNLNSQECEAFFTQITSAMKPGEYFLLGIDLHKSKDVLEPAYNDSQGVTAAFNLNMLQHLNHRFDGNFDIAQFEHWAFYNESERQIEMHLQSKREQKAELHALNLTVSLAAGETIRTEISRKFSLELIQKELLQHSLIPLQICTDPNQWFALLLCQLSPLTI